MQGYIYGQILERTMQAYHFSVKIVYQRNPFFTKNLQYIDVHGFDGPKRINTNYQCTIYTIPSELSLIFIYSTDGLRISGLHHLSSP